MAHTAPAGQSASAVLPSGHHEPDLHVSKVVVLLQYLPASQSTSAVEPALQYEPSLHASCLLGSEQK